MGPSFNYWSWVICIFAKMHVSTLFIISSANATHSNQHNLSHLHWSTISKTSFRMLSSGSFQLASMIYLTRNVTRLDLLYGTRCSKSRNASMYTAGSSHAKPHPWCMQQLAWSKRDVRKTGSSCGGMEWAGFCWTDEIHNLTRMLLNDSKNLTLERSTWTVGRRCYIL